MALLGIRVSERKAHDYFKELKHNLEEPAGFMFMYSGKIKRFKDVWVLHLTPNFMKLYIMGLFLFAGSLMLYPTIGAWSWFGFIPSFLMMSTYFFWSRESYKILVRKALSKRGVKSFSFLTYEETIKVVL